MPGSPWGNQHNIFNVTDTTVSPHEMMRPQHNIFNVTDTTVSPHEMMRLQHNIFNPLNAELNPISYLLELLGAHHFLHVSRIRVKSLTLRLLMSYIYEAPILDVSRSHTTHHSR